MFVRGGGISLDGEVIDGARPEIPFNPRSDFLVLRRASWEWSVIAMYWRRKAKIRPEFDRLQIP